MSKCLFVASLWDMIRLEFRGSYRFNIKKKYSQLVRHEAKTIFIWAQTVQSASEIEHTVT